MREIEGFGANFLKFINENFFFLIHFQINSQIKKKKKIQVKIWENLLLF